MTRVAPSAKTAFTMARMGSSSFVVACLLLALSSPAVQAGTSDHRYKPAEHVELWVNKVRIVSYRHVADSRRYGKRSDSRFRPPRTVPYIAVDFVRGKSH